MTASASVGSFSSFVFDIGFACHIFWSWPPLHISVLQKMKPLLKIVAFITLTLMCSGKNVDEISHISITTGRLSWSISVYPNGSVKACYGAVDSMTMPAGSVNFSNLFNYVVKHHTRKRVNGMSQIALCKKGVNSHSSSYVTNDEYLRGLFLSDPKLWTATFRNSDGAKMSDRMKMILAKYPIYPAPKPVPAPDAEHGVGE